MLLSRRSDGTDEHGEGEYALEYADKNARVVMVTSEPITGATSDWVVVPRNHALIVTRDAAGWMNVLHTPVYSHAPGPRLDMVLNCLKSIPLEQPIAARAPARALLLPSLPQPCAGAICVASNVHLRICSRAQLLCMCAQRTRIHALIIAQFSSCVVRVAPDEVWCAGKPSLLDRVVNGVDRSAQRPQPSCPMCGGSQFVNFHQQVLDILDTHYEPRGSGKALSGPQRSLRAASGCLPSHGSRDQLVSPLVGSPLTHGVSTLSALAEREETSPNAVHDLQSAVRCRHAATGRHTPESGLPARRCGSSALEEAVASAEAVRLTESLHLQRTSAGHTPVPAAAGTSDKRNSIDEIGRAASRNSGTAPAASSTCAQGVWQGSVPEPDLLTGHKAALLSMTQDEHGRLYTCSADKTIRVRTDVRLLSASSGLFGQCGVQCQRVSVCVVLPWAPLECMFCSLK